MGFSGAGTSSRVSNSGFPDRTPENTRRSWDRGSRSGSISEGHQSPEYDGESKKKVDWYDAALNQSSAANTAPPSLKSEKSAMSMTSPSESGFSPNDNRTSPADLGGEAHLRKPVSQSPADERKKKKKKLKGAEKVLPIFSPARFLS
jgi:hypothetical protein